MKSDLLLWSLTGLLLFLNCNQVDNRQSNSVSENTTLYYNGDIITMEGEEPEYAEALVVQDSTIAFVGSLEQAKTEFNSYQEKDLQGKTLVPGFIDGHIHFSGLGAQALAANLLAEPDGKVNTVEDLIAEMQRWSSSNDREIFDGWIVGMGYDDAILGRHPNKDDLDQISQEIPVIVVHISGHFCTLNSKGLEVSGITAESQDPVGGVIRRVPGTREPDGTLDELAGIPLLFRLISPRTPEKIDLFMNAAQEMAISFGYTTAQEGRATGSHEALAQYAKSGKLKIDVPSYIDYSMPELMETEWYSNQYQNHYRIAGLKLTLDGSPQGRTAWRTEPYLIPPPGADESYQGYPAIPDDEQVQEIVDMAFTNDWQLLTHANGDAAIDQLIRSVASASASYGNDDRRTTLIHGQYIRYDQIDSLARYDIIPSLFPMHTFYWGDWHRQLIGDKKGSHISPIQTAHQKCGVVTSHTDAPVALPNLMMIMWTTVNRITRSGDVIAPEESLSPYDALRTITIWGAYQHFEENRKGSLVQGKLADLVVLSDNPVKIDPMQLKEIEVHETIKEGVSIYQL